jgi:hypothetical protein
MEPRAFLKTRYRVKLAKDSDADHWSGGEPYHLGAQCPACRIPLLLLWDINCRDPRFPRRKFGPLERLPLPLLGLCQRHVLQSSKAPPGRKVVRGGGLAAEQR